MTYRNHAKSARGRGALPRRVRRRERGGLNRHRHRTDADADADATSSAVAFFNRLPARIRHSRHGSDLRIRYDSAANKYEVWSAMNGQIG